MTDSIQPPAANQKGQLRISDLFGAKKAEPTSIPVFSTVSHRVIERTANPPQPIGTRDFDVEASVDARMRLVEFLEDELAKKKNLRINRLDDEEGKALLLRELLPQVSTKENEYARRQLNRAQKKRTLPKIRHVYAKPDVNTSEKNIARAAETLFRRDELKHKVNLTRTKYDWDLVRHCNPRVLTRWNSYYGMAISDGSTSYYYKQRYGQMYYSPVCFICDNRYFGHHKDDRLRDGLVCDVCACLESEWSPQAASLLKTLRYQRGANYHPGSYENSFASGSLSFPFFRSRSIFCTRPPPNTPRS